MKNIRQIWQETTKRLEKVYDQREAESIAYILFEDLFDLNKTEILAGRSHKIDLILLDKSIKRLLNHEPIQYVTSIADFYGRKFHLEEGALVPRPETEELCALIIGENNLEKPKIADIGVGSGCIAITLSLELQGEVTGIDVSAKAINIARSNSDQLRADIRFIQLDVLKEDMPETNLDILVSNPPYIPNSDKADMQENVLRYEPEIALFVSNDDPLIFYKRIGKIGLLSLRKEGRLYFEIHESFGDQVKQFLEEIGYGEVIIHKDMQGKDRMISAINSASR